MSDDSSPKKAGQPPSFSAHIGVKASRKLQARDRGNPSVWSGLGVMGVIGWSAALPTVLGAAIGLWLDKRHPGHHSWTLALMLVGLVLGCFAAWNWVERQQKAIRSGQGSSHE